MNGISMDANESICNWSHYRLTVNERVKKYYIIKENRMKVIFKCETDDSFAYRYERSGREYTIPFSTENTSWIESKHECFGECQMGNTPMQSSSSI